MNQRMFFSSTATLDDLIVFTGIHYFFSEEGMTLICTTAVADLESILGGVEELVEVSNFQWGPRPPLTSM